MTIWQRIMGLQPSAPAAPRPVALPDVEDEPTRRARGPIARLELISGVACFIVYYDASGRASQRRVSCQSLASTGSHDLLHAYCHERAAYRQFRVDRIATVIDLATGEVFDPGSAFFRRFDALAPRFDLVGAQFVDSLLPRITTGLIVLSFLGRCDGTWHWAEEEIAAEFVKAFWRLAVTVERFALDPDNPPMSVIRPEIGRLVPDPETFAAALAAAQADVLLASTLPIYAEALINADGKIHSTEQTWFSDMLASLEGYL